MARVVRSCLVASRPQRTAGHGHRRRLFLPAACLAVAAAAAAARALLFMGNPFRGSGALPASAPAGREELASEDPTVKEFDTPARQELLAELERQWVSLEQKLRTSVYPAIERDPFFTMDVQGLLRRYLLAASLDVEDAIARLEATAKWRRDWDVLAYYEPGAAQELFAEASNPGAEMYFADSLLLDAGGRPYCAGRLRFANSENMHPWNHLRAGVLVFELMATKVVRAGRGPGSYILDVGGVGNRAGNVSGTAGLDRAYDESLNPYYAAGAGSKAAPSPEMLEELGSLDNGFAVLKAAISILNRHYPGIIGRVFYLNSDMLFWGAFKIFSRWIADRGSIEFKFLGPAGWREDPISRLRDSYPADQLFEEWGGTGPQLDGDDFLARAVQRYEDEAAAAQEELMASA